MNKHWIGMGLLLSVALLARAQTPIYVATNGANDVANRFNTWTGAATNIHDAVSLATNNDTILVSNGVYRLTNEIVLVAGLTLHAMNGASNTTLAAQGSGGGFRLIRLTNANASVEGFTLSNGYAAVEGGGIYMSTGTVRDCTVVGCAVPNSGSVQGGGIRMTGGALTNTTVRSCTGYNAASIYATGGTIDGCTIRDCTSGYMYGSYANNTILRRCTFFNNSAGYMGGGVYMDGSSRLESSVMSSNRVSGQNAQGGGGIDMNNGTVVNCLVINNSSADNGGGITMLSGAGSVLNCTIANNTAYSAGGGLYRSGGVVANCIIYGNWRAAVPDNYYGAMSVVSYSCAPTLTNSANGNITSDPLFLGNGDYHLQMPSPCIDSGTNLASVTNDLDLSLRPLAGNSFGRMRQDMGAYEVNGNNGVLQAGISASPAQGVDSVTCVLTALAAGTNTDIAWYGWDLTNSGAFNLTGPGLGVVTNTYGPGLYSVRLVISNSPGESASVVGANLIMVSATNIYVSTTGASKFPYSTWDNAATNIHDAVGAALSGADIQVSNGAYRVTNTISFAIPVTLHSVNGTNVTSLYRAATDAANFRLFNLNNTGTVVRGFTLSNGVSTSLGGGVFLQAGLVRDCVITNCQTSGGNNSGTGGGGVRMEGGAVSNTVIVGCKATTVADVHPQAGGVWMTAGTLAGCTIRACQANTEAGLRAEGGTIEDCTIRDNVAPYVHGSYAAGTTLRRCRIFNNTCAYDGGGINLGSGSMENCLIYSNNATARTGGGIYMSGGIVDNCTIANNNIVSTSVGGGMYQAGGAIRNTIVYGNTRAGITADDYKYSSANIIYSCAPELASGVSSNINSDPKFKDAVNFDYHLQLKSPCIDTGTNLVAITNDIDRTFRPLDGDGLNGAAWDMGAYEVPDVSQGPLLITFDATPRAGLNSVNAVFRAYPVGKDTNIVWYGWDFDNNGSFDLPGPSLGVVTQNYAVAGRYSVSLLVSNASGEAAAATNVNYIAVSAPDIFVATNSAAPSFPYSSWATAATNIHDAVGAALAGSTIHLTNGTFLARYQVILNDAIVLRGEMGATNSILARDATAGNFGVLMLTHTSAVVQGVTIAQGYATTLGGGIYLSAGTVRDCIVTNCETTGGSGTGGGGIYVVAGLVTNTVIVNCRATGQSQQGGGLWMTGGKLANNTIRACQGNTGAGFYVSGATIEDCTIRDCVSSYIYGSYADNTAIRRCRFFNNSAGYHGGAIYIGAGATLENCLIYSNQITAAPYNTSSRGGGIRMVGGTVVNCTVARNSSTDGGGGIQCDAGLVTNSIIYFNTTNGIPNDFAGAVGSAFYSCAPELTTGVQGNKTNIPLFKNAAAGDYHLLLGSPCYGAGTNFPGIAALDLDRKPRVRRGGVVDMGAYEVQPPQGMLVTFR